MTVNWAATSPSDGRFHGVFVSTTRELLRARFAELRARGEGYLEVAATEHEYPYLTMGFRGEHAVIHRFDAPESVSLRLGDKSVPSENVVNVPIMDDLDPGTFTGGVVLSVENAWRVVEEFMRGAPMGGEWYPL